MKFLRLVILFITLSAFSCNDSKKILFLGNSLTYTNDLPSILKTIAKNSEESIETKSICFPNYAIEDHWNDGDFQKLLKKEKFDFVIIQQGPSSQAEGNRMLLEYGKKIKAECDKNGAQLAYFMVWPSKRYYHTFDGVIKNHTNAAKVNKAKLFPVGKIWKAYEAENNTTNLYGSDSFHPSKAGSFLAALTIFKGIYSKKDLAKIEYKNFKNYVEDENSFKRIVELISTIIKNFN